jgi:FtsH-binding integral membrane protein
MNQAVYRAADAVNSAMLRVYNHMALAIATSGIVSLLVSSSPTLMKFLFTGVMQWIVIFAPLVFVLFLGFKIRDMSAGTARLMLYLFAAVMGLSFSTIFVVYNLGSIVSAFMGAAILFGTMSFYGYFTKRSLESVGQFMFIGLIAIVIASIVNIFIGSSVATMVISALAIIIFLGLTAYDTQQIRQMVSVFEPDSNAEIVGALTLYMDFINLFLNLLQLFGSKKD